MYDYVIAESIHEKLFARFPIRSAGRGKCNMAGEDGEGADLLGRKWGLRCCSDTRLENPGQARLLFWLLILGEGWVVVVVAVQLIVGGWEWRPDFGWRGPGILEGEGVTNVGWVGPQKMSGHAARWVLASF